MKHNTTAQYLIIIKDQEDEIQYLRNQLKYQRKRNKTLEEHKELYYTQAIEWKKSSEYYEAMNNDLSRLLNNISIKV